MNKQLLLTLVLIGLGEPAWAAAVAVEVRSLGGNQHRVALETGIAAPVPVVFGTLTDYDHHAEFLPYILSSRVTRARNGTRMVEQVGRIRVLFWTFQMQITQQVTERPPGEMRFTAIAGDFKRLEGIWRLVPAAFGTQLHCEMTLEPRRQVPAWAVRFVARRYLTQMIESLAKRAQRGVR